MGVAPVPSDDRRASEDPQLPVIGWRERVDLPEWGVHRILAKIDTGARTSAIHVEHIEPIGEDRVRFEVVIARARGDRPEQTVPVEASLVRTAKIRPSTGRLQRRPVVEAVVQIGPVRQSIELSLVSREHMLCRMLLGRSALAGAALVDVSRTYVLTDKRIRRKRRS